ncbi:Asp/Glu racemase [Pseudodonghicola sp.]|uniref:maleate cis-trans isomerase family protein n=1 Tax=Pseudodonghicola sp. TaxID=1969463 RepID=UPI003A982662
MLQDLPPPDVHLSDIPYDTDAGIGARANIGLLVLQTDQTIEDEFRHILPDGVALYHSRLKSPTEIEPAKLRLMEQEIPGATELLPSIPFAAVGFGCTSGALVIGEPQVAARVHEVLPGTRVTDPVTAAVAALKALKAERVALLTPYLPEITASLRDQFQARGLNIPVTGTFNQPDDYVVAVITPEAIKAAILELGRSDQVDAVFVSCTSMRVARIVAEIETELGKPITSSNHALAWHMLRQAGISDAMPQHGRLFETV